MPETPEAYARELYDILQRLDSDHIETILADMPPDVPEWEAIRDRLRRAALR
jgi:L-threonylcarbamoyladenylate synthase